MAIPSTFQVPLGELTRKKGKNLLILSLVSLAIVKADMVPKRITALGVDFDSGGQSLLLLALLLVVIYLFLGFVIYGTFDFMDNRAALYEEKIKAHKDDLKLTATFSSPVKYYVERRDKHWLYRPLFALRLIYDCVLPITAGLYSMWVLFWAIVGTYLLISPVPKFPA